MSRAPLQVHVLPYHRAEDGEVWYALFRRADAGYWQGIAGGGEDDETPLQAAQRETHEEAGIESKDGWVELETMSMIPVEQVCGFAWGEYVLVIPNRCSAVEVESRDLTLSDEHIEYRWMSYDEAMESLHWEDNKNALWELHQRLKRGLC